MNTNLIKFLKENPVQYLSTIGLDGRPKLRPVMMIVEKDNKLWFCTNSNKEMFKELMANPYMELCTSDPKFIWCRISGKAVFEDNLEIKNECMKHPGIKNIYKSADNPIFRVFYIADMQSTMSDFTGKSVSN